jgi:N-acetylneuraminic acid mutarotase
LAWDPTTANKVWAGGASGGLWYNMDITDANSGWVKVNDFWSTLSVTKITFDPTIAAHHF